VSKRRVEASVQSAFFVYIVMVNLSGRRTAPTLNPTPQTLNLSGAAGAYGAENGIKQGVEHRGVGDGGEMDEPPEIVLTRF
jgi:hypothetical protein